MAGGCGARHSSIYPCVGDWVAYDYGGDVIFAKVESTLNDVVYLDCGVGKTSLGLHALHEMQVRFVSDSDLLKVINKGHRI